MDEITKCNLLRELKRELWQTAEQSIFYVALGQVMAREVAEKHNLQSESAKQLIALAATQLIQESKPHFCYNR